jgi:hypothetical protein
MAWGGAFSFWFPWLVAAAPFALLYYYLWKGADAPEKGE